MEFAIPIHHSGPYKGLPVFEEILVQLKEGRRTNLVADVLIHDSSGGHICRSQIRRQQFILQADLPVEVSKVTILNARISQIRGPVCIADDSAVVLKHQPTQASDLFRLVETCTGLGSLGCGAEFAGFKVVAQNDMLPTFCEHLKGAPNRNPMTVIEGDICKLDTMIKLHAASDGAKALAFGFSCQPFSTLGDMKEGDDERSSTLSFGLYCGYLLQMGLIVMECTPKAPSSRFVKVCLQYFEEVTGFTKSEALLELADIWPSRRRRWWCILNHPAFGKIHINPMPKLSKPPVISDVLPAFLQLSPTEYQALQLSAYERQCFQQFAKSPQGCLVDFHGPLDTALHSWGNQCGECQCGCGRKFSQTRLREHGIFGALVHDPTKADDENLRHLSAQEMAILCGFPLQYGWHAPARFLTAGVGQLASSMQSAWVFGQIRRHLFHLKVAGLTDCQPKEILACVCAELFNLRDSMFAFNTSVAMDLFREAIETMLFPLGHEAHQMRPRNCLDVEVLPEPIPVIPVAESVDSGDSDTKQVDADASPNTVDPNQYALVPVHGNPNNTNVAMEVEYLKQCCADELILRTPDVVDSTIWDTTTGGCKLFSSKQSTQLLAEPMDVIAPPSKFAKVSHDQGNVAAGGVEKLDFHSPPPVIVRAPQFGFQPTDLIDENSFLVWDDNEHSFYVIRVSPHQTVAGLLQADQVLGHRPERRNLFDAVGQVVSPAAKLTDLGWGTIAVALIPPQMPLHTRVNLLRTQHRLVALMNQGGAVAFDEMVFYLTAIHETQQVGMLVPLVIPYLMDLQQQSVAWISEIPVGTSSVSAILVNNHWIPFVIHNQGASFDVVTVVEGQQIGQLIFQSLTVQYHVIPAVPVTFRDGCGFQAIAVILAVIAGVEVSPFTRQKASAWRLLFWQKVYVGQQPFSEGHHLMLGSAQSPELETAIATLLREHGVASDQVVDRAKQVISRLGAVPIQQALQSDRPWPAIKALANASSPPFRLIQPAEFQQVVKQRTRSDRQVKSKKMPKTQGTVPAQFSPGDLVIPEGVFCQMPDGHNLAHLTLRQVHPKAKGVVLCVEAEVQPFLSQTQISNEGLAFLVMAPFSPELGELGEVLRFPAQSIATVEPVLLTAVMIQKGTKAVQRSRPPTQLEVDQVSTRTLKLFLYRDQTAVDWNEVVRKPVKCILETLQCLQQCKIAHCKCPKWHEGEHEPLLDVWQRSFLTLNFSSVKPHDAVLFTCAIRVVEPVASQLFDLSGTAGIYVEPRTHDGKQHDGSTQTVWLPKHTLQQALAAKSTASVTTSLIRVGHRYGLRASTTEAPQLHVQFRPDVPYLPGDSKEEFLVGPLPWGTTRVALVRLFAQWNWVAKPLQPAGRSADSQGLMWLVHATQSPPNSVYTMVHGDVLVVKQTQGSKSQAALPAVEASKFTKQQLRPADEDWDPWAAAAATLPANRVDVSQAQLRSIEASLEQKLTAKLSRTDGDTDMEPGIDNRLTVLESQMKSMQQVQQTQQSQTQALSSKVDQIKNELDVQSSKFQTHLDDKLSEQMQRIEALFAKRHRQE